MIPRLFDKTGETKICDLTNCIECYVEEERNGLFEVSIVYPNDGVANYLVEENIIVCDANDTLKNQLFRIYQTKRLMSNTIEIVATHISFDLKYDYIAGLDIQNQSCEYVLNEIFRGSQFSQKFTGYSNIINAQDYKMSMANCYEAISGKAGSIIDTFGTGAEILRDNYEFHVLDKRGHDNGVSIEYAKNLTGFELEEDTKDLITRILPHATYLDEEGKEATMYGDFIDSPLINNYAHPYVAAIDYTDRFGMDESPTPEKLNTLAEREYSVNKRDISRQSFKIEFVPLSKCVGYEGLEDKISLCDVVTIKDTRYGIDTKAKAVRTVYDVLRDRYESIELGESRVTLGNVIEGNKGEDGKDGNIENFPDTLPNVPILTGSVIGLGSIELTWTFENKLYYQYEVYGSRDKGFTPSSFNRIHIGQTSSYLFQAKPNETWYFKACAINSHGRRTSFSEEIEIVTAKVEDIENYFTSAAIGEAVVGVLSSDYMTAGIIKGHHIDARNLSVTDGNGKRTLDIDSYGNVFLDVTSLNLNSTSVEETLNAFERRVQGAEQTMTPEGIISIVGDTFIAKGETIGGHNYVKNGRFAEAQTESNPPEWTITGNVKIPLNVYHDQAEDVMINLEPIDPSSTAEGIITQYLTDVPRNTEVTLGFKFYREQNTSVPVIRMSYEKGGIVTPFKEIVMPTDTDIILHEYHTFDTPDVEYDGIYLSFVVTSTIANATQLNIVSFGNVQLVDGAVPTGWQENTTYKLSSEFTTKTEFQQTAEDFTFKISQSGGGNLFKNSKFKDGTKYWSYDNWDSTYVENMTQYVWGASKTDEWGHATVNTLCTFFGVKNVGDYIRATIRSPWVEVEPNSDYSLSFYYRQHRADCYYEIQGMKADGSWGTIYAWDFDATYDQTDGTSWSKDFSSWWYETKTFTIPSDIVKVLFWIVVLSNVSDANEPNAYVWLGEPCLVKGSTPMHWLPHESELYDGIVKIDDQGISVQHGNNKSVLDSEALNFYSGDTRYSRVKGGKFEFTDSNGNPVGDVGKSTWVGTNLALTSLNARFGHSVGIGAQYDDGNANYSAPLIICSKDGELTTSGGHYFQGVNISNPKVSGTLVLRGSTNDTEQLNLQGMVMFANYGDAYRTGNIFGNEEIHLGTQYGTEFWDGMIIKENANQNSKNELHIYGPLDMHNYPITRTQVTAEVNAATTYTTRLLNEGSIENKTYGGTTFTEGELRYVHRQTCHTVEEWDYNEQGEYVPLGVYYCYCELPIFMAENIELDYHVNIGKIGWGDYRVIEKNPYLFIVESKEEGFAFTWEVVAKQVEVPGNNIVVANEYIDTGRNHTPPEDNDFTYKLDGEE